MCDCLFKLQCKKIKMDARIYFYHSLGHLLFIKDHNELLVIGLLLRCSRMNLQNQIFPLFFLRWKILQKSCRPTMSMYCWRKCSSGLLNDLFKATLLFVLRLQLLLCLVRNTFLLLCTQMYSSEDEMGLLKYINRTTKITYFR